MFKKVKSVLVASGLLFSLSSFAGISIEPLIGYNWVTDVQVDGGGGDGHYNWGGGSGWGAKVGYFKDKKHGLSGGLSYLNTTTSMTNNDFDRDINASEWGLYANYNLPLWFKVYGEFIFSADASTKIKENTYDNENGWGWKVGAGTRIIPFIELNVDYRKIYYTHMDFNAIFLSASWPIHLFE